jgi:post-segregation antitoxin (ccd killing protein)
VHSLVPPRGQAENRKRDVECRFGGAVRGAWINISRVAEAALIAAFKAAEKAKIRQEMQEDARWVSEYVAQHGYPFPEAMAAFTPNEAEDDAA